MQTREIRADRRGTRRLTPTTRPEPRRQGYPGYKGVTPLAPYFTLTGPSPLAGTESLQGIHPLQGETLTG